PVAARQWNGFTGRLPAVLATLDRERVNYRIPDVLGLEGDHLILGDSAVVTLTPVASGTIRFTLDGSLPTGASAAYTGPIPLALSAAGTTVSARLERPDGRLGSIRRAVWRKAVYLDASRLDASELTSGLNYQFAPGRADSVGGVARLNVTRRSTVPDVRLMGDEAGDRWGVSLDGWIFVPADAIYEFSLSSDDGSLLWIDDQRVVDNDGYHAAEPKQGMVPLRRGLHRIKVVVFQGGGAASLSLGWRREGDQEFRPVPGSALFRSQEGGR
ncbi:MAG TPA: PA14 domain-containing protein, partial [Gemmatimonadales bacterium]|nr:PA14 domain-containing protein [Gemmatimonadales bacterium]